MFEYVQLEKVSFVHFNNEKYQKNQKIIILQLFNVSLYNNYLKERQCTECRQACLLPLTGWKQ